MKLTSIIAGQAIRLLSIEGSKGAHIFIPKLARAVESRYEFYEIPRKLEDYDLDGGITFRHGLFEDALIERLQIYANGIIVESRINTELCEKFIDDLIGWSAEHAGIVFGKDGVVQRYYISTIEFESAIDLRKLFKPVAFLTKEINNHLKMYTGLDTTFDFNSFQAKQSTPNSTFYQIEKSLKSTKEQQVFTSSAPLSTQDHIALVERLEKALQSL